MSVTCKNCDQSFEGKYCSNCGQAADTKRIDRQFIWHQFMYGILHMHNDLYTTLKALTTRPGHAIRDYLNGKRIGHIKPVMLVLLLAGTYSALIHFLQADVRQTSTVGMTSVEHSVRSVNSWITTHYAWATLLTIPIYAFLSYFLFKRQGYNYPEHLVLNAYAAGQRLLFRIVMTSLLFVIIGELVFSGHWRWLLMLLDCSLLVWTYFQFFTKQSWYKIAPLSMLVYLLSLGLEILTVAFIGLMLAGR